MRFSGLILKKENYYDKTHHRLKQRYGPKVYTIELTNSRPMTFCEDKKGHDFCDWGRYAPHHSLDVKDSSQSGDTFEFHADEEFRVMQLVDQIDEDPKINDIRIFLVDALESLRVKYNHSKKRISTTLMNEFIEAVKQGEQTLIREEDPGNPFPGRAIEWDDFPARKFTFTLTQPAPEKGMWNIMLSRAFSSTDSDQEEKHWVTF